VFNNFTNVNSTNNYLLYKVIVHFNKYMYKVKPEIVKLTFAASLLSTHH